MKANLLKCACFAAALACASCAFAIPRGHDGFTADERQELRSLTRQALAKKMKRAPESIRFDSLSAQAYDNEAEYVQVMVEVASSSGKPIDWSKMPCDNGLHEGSPVAFALFKRQNHRWILKDTVLCALEHPDWRDVKFDER